MTADDKLPVREFETEDQRLLYAIQSELHDMADVQVGLLTDIAESLRAVNRRLERLENLVATFVGGKNAKVLLALLSARTGGRR